LLEPGEVAQELARFPAVMVGPAVERLVAPISWTRLSSVRFFENSAIAVLRESRIGNGTFTVSK
jgi:hypothetical protein